MYTHAAFLVYMQEEGTVPEPPWTVLGCQCRVIVTGRPRALSPYGSPLEL